MEVIMKKKTKRRFTNIVILAVLSAMLAFAASGCASSGGSSGGSAQTPDGTYTAGVDMRESLSKSSGMEINTELVMNLVLTFRSGKDYTLELDTEQFTKDTIAYYEGEMPSLIKQSLLDTGLTEADIEELAKSKGYANYDEYAAAMLDEQLENMKEQFATMGGVLSEGTFEVNGKSIALKDSGGANVAQNGTIEDDGSLSFDVTVNGEKKSVTFTR